MCSALLLFAVYVTARTDYRACEVDAKIRQNCNDLCSISGQKHGCAYWAFSI